MEALNNTSVPIKRSYPYTFFNVWFIKCRNKGKSCILERKKSYSTTLLFSNSPWAAHTAFQVQTRDGFHLKRVLETDEDVDSLAEHPAVGGQGQVGHHSVQHSAPGHLKLIVGGQLFNFQHTLPNLQNNKCKA